MILRAATLASALICALAGPLAGVAFAQTVPEPEGFRSEPYLAPVPATLQGATVIDATRAIVLHEQGVAFIDTLPRQKRPEGLPAGTIWRGEVHFTIPGAVWLYDTGYDRISAAEETRLADGLARATGGDKSAPVVMFCKSDCWMSWNAAKRAVALGYRGVNWFPQGVEGWVSAGGELMPTDPP